MNKFASFFGLGTPELFFIIGLAAAITLIFILVKAFFKGYSSNKATSASKKQN